MGLISGRRRFIIVIAPIVSREAEEGEGKGRSLTIAICFPIAVYWPLYCSQLFLQGRLFSCIQQR